MLGDQFVLLTVFKRDYKTDKYEMLDQWSMRCSIYWKECNRAHFKAWGAGAASFCNHKSWHFSHSTQNKRTCYRKVKTENFKILIHQTQAKRIHASRVWALKNTFRYMSLSMWESRPLFLVLAPWDSHKKKYKKYRIQNSMVDCSPLLFTCSNQPDRIRRKKIKEMKDKRKIRPFTYSMFSLIAPWQNENLQRCMTQLH